MSVRCGKREQSDWKCTAFVLGRTEDDEDAYVRDEFRGEIYTYQRSVNSFPVSVCVAMFAFIGVDSASVCATEYSVPAWATPVHPGNPSR